MALSATDCRASLLLRFAPLEQELHAAVQGVAAAEGHIKQWEGELKTLDTAKNTHGDKLDKLNEDIDVLITKINKTKSAADQHKKRLEGMKKQIVDLEAKFAQFRFFSSRFSKSVYIS